MCVRSPDRPAVSVVLRDAAVQKVVQRQFRWCASKSTFYYPKQAQLAAGRDTVDAGLEKALALGATPARVFGGTHA